MKLLRNASPFDFLALVGVLFTQVVVAVFLYLTVWPVDPITTTVDPNSLPAVVDRSANTVVLEGFERCYHFDDDDVAFHFALVNKGVKTDSGFTFKSIYEVRRELVDVVKGCLDSPISFPIPDEAPLGTYHAEWSAHIRVNQLRTIVETFRSVDLHL